MNLDDRSVVESHHNFITLSEKIENHDILSKPLACELHDRIQYDSMFGIPTQNKSLTDAQKELLSWHYRLGHMSFHSLQKLSKLGVIPQHLVNVSPAPLCSSCAFDVDKNDPGVPRQHLAIFLRIPRHAQEDVSQWIR